MELFNKNVTRYIKNMSQPEANSPRPLTKDEIQNIVKWAIYTIPILIEIFAISTLFTIKSCHFAPNFTYVLVATFHAIRFYNAATSFAHSHDDSIFKTILYSIDIHIIVFVVAFAISGRVSFLFFVAIVLKELDPLLFGITNLVVPFAKNLEKTLNDFRDSVKKNEYIAKARAIIEILLLPYLFFAGLFTFSSCCFIGFAIYFVGYIWFMYLIDEFHKWVWAWLNDKFSAFAKQNDQSFGPYVTKVLESFATIGEFAKKIYPDANKFFEIIKRKVE